MSKSVKPFISVEFTPEFKRNIRHLIKKYRNIKEDVQPVIEKLKNGLFEGDKVAGTEFNVYKIRLKNSDNNKGKSSGYRVIYYVVTSEKTILVTIYSKNEQSDISAKQIKLIIAEFSLTLKEK